MADDGIATRDHHTCIRYVMKADTSTPVYICLLLGISLIFNPIFGSCLDSSSHSSKRLDESGFVQVRLKAPDLFLQCSIQENPHNKSCLFKLESDDSEADLTWSIPAGKRSDARTVSVVTFVSALLSVLCIVLSMQLRQHNVQK